MKRAVACAAIGLGLVSAAQASFVNGGFETVNVAIPAMNFIITPQSNVPGWTTSAGDGMIEVWQNPGFTGEVNRFAYEGTRWAELNANVPSTLYQTVSASAIPLGVLLEWELAHRGRDGVDTMRLFVTDLGANGIYESSALAATTGGDDSNLVSQIISTGNGGWVLYGADGIMSLGNDVRFEFAAIASATSSNDPTSYGNFLDATYFGVYRVPEPASLLLLGTALLGVGASRRAKKSA